MIRDVLPGELNPDDLVRATSGQARYFSWAELAGSLGSTARPFVSFLCVLYWSLWDLIYVSPLFALLVHS